MMARVPPSGAQMTQPREAPVVEDLHKSFGPTFVIAWLFKLWERRWHAHLRARDGTGESSELQAGLSARQDG